MSLGHLRKRLKNREPFQREPAGQRLDCLSIKRIRTDSVPDFRFWNKGADVFYLIPALSTSTILGLKCREKKGDWLGFSGPK